MNDQTHKTVLEVLDGALRDPEVHAESVIRALRVAGLTVEQYGQVPTEHIEGEPTGWDHPENKLLTEQISKAEEPIEHRLRRAFMNGFREGVEMASWRDGQWDFV